MNSELGFGKVRSISLPDSARVELEPSTWLMLHVTDLA